MAVKNSRRSFFKHLFALSAFSSASILSLRKGMDATIPDLGPTEACAMNNPDYAVSIPDNGIKIEYMGMSCFIITASNGTRIITDPFLAGPGGQILHPELNHEPADVVTISCGHYTHCNVFAVGGFPYIYKITEPSEIKGIKFRGVSTRHLEMKEVSKIRPDGENIVMCFEVEGIRICHLGALGHKLTGDQVKEIGKVDILMVPVGGVSTLPVVDANDVCDQLNPKIIFPMHYRSERCIIPTWAPVDDFLKGKKNVTNFTMRGFGEMTFKLSELPAETLIIAAGYPH